MKRNKIIIHFYSCFQGFRAFYRSILIQIVLNKLKFISFELFAIMITVFVIVNQTSASSRVPSGNAHKCFNLQKQ